MNPYANTENYWDNFPYGSPDQLGIPNLSDTQSPSASTTSATSPTLTRARTPSHTPSRSRPTSMQMQMEMHSGARTAHNLHNIASNNILSPQGFSFPYSIGPMSTISSISSIPPIAQYPGPYRTSLSEGSNLSGTSPQDITVFPQHWVVDGTLHIPPSAGSPSQMFYSDIGLGAPSPASGSPRTFEQRVASSPSQYLEIPSEGLHAPLYPFTPVVPSSSSSESLSLDMDGSNSSSGGGNMANIGNTFSSIEARRQNVLSWMASTNLLPSQREVAMAVLSSTWWENEEPEPEVRPNDPLVLRRLIPVGGSRFRCFLDEENGYRCTFDHDGKPCTHGKGRTERALGTIRGFFKYKPIQCSGACGSRCQQRFVSVEQCQKHVQKKRSGRVACPDCGSSILPANLSRHRRTYHAPGDNA